MLVRKVDKFMFFEWKFTFYSFLSEYFEFAVVKKTDVIKTIYL